MNKAEQNISSKDASSDRTKSPSLQRPSKGQSSPKGLSLVMQVCENHSASCVTPNQIYCRPDTPPEVSSTYHERALEKMRKTGNRPGYPLSAFCIYSQQQRDRLKALNPDVPQALIIQQIKKAWKTAPNKQQFEEQARKDYRDYRQLMAVWEEKFKSKGQSKAAQLLIGSGSPQNSESKEPERMKLSNYSMGLGHSNDSKGEVIKPVEGPASEESMENESQDSATGCLNQELGVRPGTTVRKSVPGILNLQPVIDMPLRKEVERSVSLPDVYGDTKVLDSLCPIPAAQAKFQCQQLRNEVGAILPELLSTDIPAEGSKKQEACDDRAKKVEPETHETDVAPPVAVLGLPRSGVAQRADGFPSFNGRQSYNLKYQGDNGAKVGLAFTGRPNYLTPDYESDPLLLAGDKIDIDNLFVTSAKTTAIAERLLDRRAQPQLQISTDDLAQNQIAGEETLMQPTSGLLGRRRLLMEQPSRSPIGGEEGDSVGSPLQKRPKWD